MQVTVNRASFQRAIELASMAVNPRSPKAVLTGVKITADKSGVRVSGTDLETHMQTSFAQCEVAMNGEAVIDAAKIGGIVKASTDDTLAIETSGDDLIVKGNDSRFKLPTMAVKDFPPMLTMEVKAEPVIDAATFKAALGQVAFAAATEAGRFSFNGVMLRLTGKKAELVATDGRRMAMTTFKAEGKSEPATIPIGAVRIIGKMLGDGDASIGIGENAIRVTTPDACFQTSLVQGQFPPHEDVIPKGCDKQMTAATADFLSAIRRAALLTTDDSKGVRLAFTKKGVVITGRSPEAGEATITFPCKNDGDGLEIGFNPAFLAEGLAVAGDEVTLDMTAANRPGLMRSGSWQYIIMPVSLQ
jgi:DNA polymerase III subunit beta